MTKSEPNGLSTATRDTGSSRLAPRDRRRRFGARMLMATLFALVPFGCVYDPDNRCDPGQHEEEALCVCDEGLVQAEVGCEPCGAHATAVDGMCQCDAGYARATPEDACEEVSAELGQSCDPTAEDPGCPAKFSFCQPSSFDGGYCTTSGCDSDDDCSGGYACDDRATPSFCARPPTGVGAACETHDDCEGEATYCVTIMSGGCAIEGCSPPDVGCPINNECCDLSSFGLTQLCVPDGMCPN